jgi:AcrR family transcriptional regulator
MKSPAAKRMAAAEGESESQAAARIVAAARRYFFAHGFRGVTMDDLARELGMSKKTLYAAFPSKFELLRAVLLDKFHEVDADLEGVTAAASADVVRVLRQLLASMQRHTEEIQPPFVRDISREAPDLFKLIEERRRQIIERHFGRIFEAGRRSGIIRKDLSTRLMIEMLLGLTEAIMNPPRMQQLGLTPHSGYLSIMTVVFEGLLTEKGRARKGDPPERGAGRGNRP